MRIILHIDVNNAFLSWTAVWMLKNGSKIDIRNKYAVIAGDEDGSRGIVVAKSYPCKRAGVMTTDTLYMARKKCPYLEVYKSNFKIFNMYSNLMYNYLLNYTDKIERYSIDECFLDFMEEPGRYTLKAQLSRYHNLFLLKAFTKRYAMAGIRLGYGITENTELLDAMTQVTQPWNISVMAQAAGIAALKETAYVEEGRQMVFREAKYLKEELQRLGMEVFPSEANYIFFHGPENLFEICVEHGVLIRDCSNYSGLRKGYYRVAVRYGKVDHDTGNHGQCRKESSCCRTLQDISSGWIPCGTIQIAEYGTELFYNQ